MAGKVNGMKAQWPRLAAMAVLVGTFFSIAGAVTAGKTKALDTWVFLSLRTQGDPSDPIGSRSIEGAARDVTALGGATLLAAVCFAAILAFLFHRRRVQALLMIAAMMVAWAAARGMKIVYGRPRPDLVPHETYVFTGSFPSAHATHSAAVFLTLAMLISSLDPPRATKALVCSLAVLVFVAVGVSRVYLGVHWPSDVLAGWCLGAACALAAQMVLRCVEGAN